jgi:hypothetical protein
VNLKTDGESFASPLGEVKKEMYWIAGNVHDAG